jgi:hypothetical protein
MAFEINCCLGNDVREVLGVLTLRVRVLSVLQIARTWPRVLAALKRLEAQGLVFSFTAVAHPELPLLGPVVAWRPGCEQPDFSKASHQLRSRWKLPGKATKCIIASKAAGRMFGGHGGRYPRESEETHDLHLAAVYLRYRLNHPALCSSWIHEEEMKRDRKQQRGRVPDAVINKTKVVEFGGAYKKEKLLSFHKFCETRGLEYEVW